VIVTEEKGKVGQEAILNYFEVEEKKREDVLAAAYETAKEKRSFTFEPPFSCSHLIGRDGKTQRSLLLPNGERIGAPCSIGFGPSKHSPSLLAIRYSKAETGYWLTFERLSKHNPLERVEVLLSETKSGKDAILKAVKDTEDNNLPEVFKRTAPLRLNSFKAQETYQDKSLSIDLSKKEERSVTFVEGEAFEQIAGVLLASVSPEKKVIPQYCLKVSVKEKFFGVRADYKVGEHIFEVKWGAATSNIEETYEKHKEYLGSVDNYTVLTLLSNSELKVPHETFANLVEYSPLKNELQGVLAYLAKLVENENADAIEALRDYLYSLQREEKDLLGENRTNKFGEALRALNEVSEKERMKYLAKNTSSHFPSLEAHFEYEGAVHRSFISPKALYDENPELYNVLYGFGDMLF
jgi:hypothetical protein